jgi:opacity protein-like surface antigen
VRLFFRLVSLSVCPAYAQHTSWGDLSASVARVDYDLSGVGSAPGVAVRLTRDLSSNVSLEVGGLFAKPDQQFGRSSLFMPEAQIRYRWNAGRLSPYVGGGLGTALVKSAFHSDWDPTLSVAAGTGVRLTDRLRVTGEFRLRAHEWRATGTTTELSAGLAWALPSF